MRGGKEREKQRAREEKNDLANFFLPRTRAVGQPDCETKAPPAHLSSIHSPFKGIKGVYIYIYIRPTIISVKSFTKLTWFVALTLSRSFYSPLISPRTF